MQAPQNDTDHKDVAETTEYVIGYLAGRIVRGIFFFTLGLIAFFIFAVMLSGALR